MERQYDMRERKRTRMRLMIQREAFKLFAEKGYGETTVEQIAEAAAISPRTFFRYFPTKEDVVMWDEYDPLVEDIFLSRPRGETPFDSLRAVIITALHGLYERDPELLRTRTRLFATDTELRARFLDLQAQGADEVVRMWTAHRGLKGRQDELELRVLSGAMNAAVAVGLERWQRSGAKRDPSVFVDEAIDALANATSRLRRPRPDSRSRASSSGSR
jgi:AcrR family transcriptional regulator